MSAPNDPGAAASQDTALVTEGYDAVYAGGPDSPTLNRLWQQHASGPDYPAEFGHISFLTMAEVEQIVAATRVRTGDRLVDLACGAGGPGLLIARETGATLVGIDLSPVGVSQATARAHRVGLAHRAEFRTGAFEASGLPDGSADAVTTFDAFQYSTAKRAALTEITRILRPGGRFVFTTFEVEPDAVQGYPVLGVDPIADYRDPLEEAGLVIDSYQETPGWNERLTAAFQAVLDEHDALTTELGEQGYASLSLEVSITLGIHPYRRRVLGIATKP